MNEVFQASDKSKAKVVLFPSSSKTYMSGKIPYVFRQDTDFFYLTGCLEPDVLLVLVMPPGTEDYETYLFFPKNDKNASKNLSFFPPVIDNDYQAVR